MLDFGASVVDVATRLSWSTACERTPLPTCRRPMTSVVSGANWVNVVVMAGRRCSIASTLMLDLIQQLLLRLKRAPGSIPT
jgi:hypothetical protein